MKASTTISKLSLRAAIGVAAFTIAIGSAQAQPKELSILSGSPGGTWYPVTAGIAEIFSKNGTRTNAEVGAGLANMARISAGQSELAVTTSTVPPVARNGVAPFKEKITDVRGLAVLFPSYQHVGVTRESGATSIKDLAGMEVNCMAIGNSTHAAFVDRLKAADMTEDDLECARGSHTFASNAIKDGNLEGFTLLSGYPNGTYTELFHAKEMRLLPMNEAEAKAMQDGNPGYAATEIPAGSYPGQTEAIPTVRSDLIMIAHEDMSDDDAYWVVKTLLENLDDIRSVHSVMRPITPEYMAAITGIEMHPGAIRAFEEAGVLTAIK
jgi:hypothetical protein